MGKLKSRNALYMAVFLRHHEPRRGSFGCAPPSRVSVRASASEGRGRAVAGSCEPSRHVGWRSAAAFQIRALCATVISAEPRQLRMLCPHCRRHQGGRSGVWNGWKGQLLRQLYFERALLQAEARSIRAASSKRRRRLPRASPTGRKRTGSLSEAPRRCLLALHRHGIRSATPASSQRRTTARDFSRAHAHTRYHRITLYAGSSGLFARFAGACAVARHEHRRRRFSRRATA